MSLSIGQMKAGTHPAAANQLNLELRIQGCLFKIAHARSRRPYWAGDGRQLTECQGAPPPLVVPTNVWNVSSRAKLMSA
jgi:hypothetical protein